MTGGSRSCSDCGRSSSSMRFARQPALPRWLAIKAARQFRANRAPLLVCRAAIIIMRDRLVNSVVHSRCPEGGTVQKFAAWRAQRGLEDEVSNLRTDAEVDELRQHLVATTEL